ncbi:MAG: fluoride efflux transporter CrcB [Syntrophobacteraceae bacterium]|nr:fluoride efflux transporter CrcB [Desulfobacteraceae bacterium]
MAGGSFGSLTRFLVNRLAESLVGPVFPWPTLFVNLAGCVLVGFCLLLSERTRLLGPSARLFIITGFLGGLTTFSAYPLETAEFMREGADWELLANILANNAGGAFLAPAGLWLGSGFLRESR